MYSYESGKLLFIIINSKNEPIVMPSCTFVAIGMLCKCSCVSGCVGLFIMLYD